MTKYTYVLKADQQTGGYHNRYLGMDIPVTVVAENYEEAKEEAIRVLPPIKSGAASWAFWSNGISVYEEPFPPPPEVHESASEPQARKKMRLRGVR